MSSKVETSLIVNSQRFLNFAWDNSNGTIHHSRSCISPAQKNRDAVLSASPFQRTILRLDTCSDLRLANCSVVGEVQVVRSGTIEVDPTLDNIAVTRIDRHTERGRAVCGNRDARRDGDPAIASAQGPSIVNAGDSAPKRIRGELRHRDGERLRAPSRVGQRDV